MLSFSLTFMTIAIYLIGSGCQMWAMYRKSSFSSFLAIVLGFIAVFLQGNILYHLVDTPLGQNLSILNVLSLVTWLAVLVVLLANLFKPIRNLFLLAFPLAAFFLLLGFLFEGDMIIHTSAHPKELIHILLSILTFSILVLAALQALFLLWQEYLLKHKKTISLLQILPPLQTMEAVLFKLVSLGFILLTLVLITSFCFFSDIFLPPLLNKTIFTLLAWLVFAVLLGGRVIFGWRGIIAAHSTWIGVVFLLLAYLSSQALMVWLR